MADTLLQYNRALTGCRDVFAKKMGDYGTAWRILRLPSLTDQLYIKAMRIRSIEEAGTPKVDEGIEPEFVALVNYSYLALVQLELDSADPIDLPAEQALAHYDRVSARTRELMLAKNHDYGEAWRDMRISSLTDLILMKLHRIKQIEDNAGAVSVSEGVAGGYADIANYALFALIKLP